jgi:predicted enzyme related to lactoylglutathione lyase
VPEQTDPFDALRRPIVAQRPRPQFAAVLERRLREELAMPLVDDLAIDGDASAIHGSLRMVHLRVGDADRAMRFFDDLFGWVGERYVEGHVSHYTLNTAVTVRLLDDPDSAAVRPNYAVRDVDATIRAIEASGGRVTGSETTPDGGGWAFAEDRNGVPLVVLRPYNGGHGASDTPVRGDVALVFLKEDAGAVADFYGPVLGWELHPAHPGSSYFDVVERVGVWDENAALGTHHAASVTLYLEVPALRPAVARLEGLGGSAEAVPAETTMGPYFSVMCTDDQGTAFGLMSAELDPQPVSKQ